VDVTPVSREAVNDPSLIAGDGLHPSGKMYAEWAKLALPVALQILE
jgi:lysophospholipase L1-like esterase